MADLEQTPAPDHAESTLEASAKLAGLSSTLRELLRAAVTESPADRRLQRLKDGLESGKISEAYDGNWVAMCYEEQRQMDIDDPYITSADVRSGAIVLTREDMEEIAALAYIDQSGEEVVIDSDSLGEGSASVLVVFPDEVGKRG